MRSRLKFWLGHWSLLVNRKDYKRIHVLSFPKTLLQTFVLKRVTHVPEVMVCIRWLDQSFSFEGSSFSLPLCWLVCMCGCSFSSPRAIYRCTHFLIYKCSCMDVCSFLSLRACCLLTLWQLIG